MAQSISGVLGRGRAACSFARRHSASSLDSSHCVLSIDSAASYWWAPIITSAVSSTAMRRRPAAAAAVSSSFAAQASEGSASTST